MDTVKNITFCVRKSRLLCFSLSGAVVTLILSLCVPGIQYSVWEHVSSSFNLLVLLDFEKYYVEQWIVRFVSTKICYVVMHISTIFDTFLCENLVFFHPELRYALAERYWHNSFWLARSRFLCLWLNAYDVSNATRCYVVDIAGFTREGTCFQSSTHRVLVSIHFQKMF